MSFVPLAPPYQHVDDAIEKVRAALAPDVVRIRYEFGEDWTGSPAIFFRIVISDEVSRPPRLSMVSRRVRSEILDEVRPNELGREAYFNFRSISEAEEMKEEGWA